MANPPTGPSPDAKHATRGNLVAVVVAALIASATAFAIYFLEHPKNPPEKKESGAVTQSSHEADALPPNVPKSKSVLPRDNSNAPPQFETSRESEPSIPNIDKTQLNPREVLIKASSMKRFSELPAITEWGADGNCNGSRISLERRPDGTILVEGGDVAGIYTLRQVVSTAFPRGNPDQINFLVLNTDEPLEIQSKGSNNIYLKGAKWGWCKT